MMDRFGKAEESDGKFYLSLSSGAYGIAFKEKWQAERVLEALNDAYNKGKEEIRSGLRDLIGAAAEPDEYEE